MSVVSKCCRWLPALLLVFPGLAGAEESSARSPVAPFTLPDFRGQEHSLNDWKEKQVLVVAFLGTECPLAKLYGPRLAQLAAQYDSEKVAFVGIMSNRQDSLAKIAAYARTHDIKFPLLKDLENKVADQFGAQRTPEVFVLDAERRVRYQGRIDDQWGIGYVREDPKSRELATALDELVSGKPVSVGKTEAVGCLIGRVLKPQSAGSDSVTYSNQIARLLQKRCVECHREGEIGPFALTSYEDAVGWAPMMLEVVEAGRMPPWHASPDHGHFEESRRLTDEEKSLLRQWVAAGAPEGNRADLPQPIKFPTGWQIAREPDLVLNMREQPFEVPAEGEVRYQFFIVDPGFTEDKWVNGAELLPGNRAVVHHILVHAAKDRDGFRALEGGAGGGFLCGYVPGLRARPYPEGMAKRIPAGSKLVFQVHYTPNGSKQLDLSKLGLWFADDAKVTHEVKTIACATVRLAIPPFESDYEIDATSRALPTEALLLRLMPHMHVRGKAFRYEAMFPDGKTETLLDVPAYDFNWQTAYRLAEPIKLPAGTRMHCIAKYDNSEDNLNNPDPSKMVRWGDQTWEEMMIGYFDIAVTRAAAAEIATDEINGQRPATERRGAGPLGGMSPRAIFTLLDRNRDSKLSKDEIPERLKAVFERLDKDESGDLTVDELPQR
jgi:peroxiredoxin